MKSIGIRLDDEKYEEVRKLAFMAGLSKAAYMRKVLEEFLAGMKEKP